MKSWSLVAVGLGMALIVSSVIWVLVFSPSRTWTPEKNSRMNDLSVAAHKLGGELDSARRRPSMHGRSPAMIEEEYKKTTDELSQLKAEFENKQQGPKTTATVLRWTGIACVILGGIVVLSNRN
jgi:hypothetical protein